MAEDVEGLTIQIPPVLMGRIQALIAEESLGFTSVRHYVAAALHSFTRYKEDEVKRFRGDRP
ncbi:MAG: hypothetical protein V3U30_02935 [Thermoplasmata archaeon]